MSAPVKGIASEAYNRWSGTGVILGGNWSLTLLLCTFFMTSHSKEAIEKVLGLDEHIQQSINLYTLYKHKGSNLVRRMTCAEAIEASDYLGIDLR